MSVKLVSITQGAGELVNKTAQELIAYTARVSNPNNQMNFETAPKLLAYLIKHKHWSPFEMVHVTLEFTTSRGISPQIIRHGSFKFQEFSQRYAEVTEFVDIHPRKQDNKNRQNSTEDLSDEDYSWFIHSLQNLQNEAQAFYKEALKRGIAKESARFGLPASAKTTIYMSGSLRSWIHWCEVRCDPSTQKEHRDLALAAKKIISREFPDVATALEWV